MNPRTLHVEKVNVKVAVMPHRFFRRDYVSATAFLDDKPIYAWRLHKRRQAQIDENQKIVPAFVFRYRRDWFWCYRAEYYRANFRVPSLDMFTAITGQVLPEIQGSTKETWLRQPIPAWVKAEVWKRDGGRCVQCGTGVDLEFDHIIPVAEGGGNSPGNIQLLCGTHNRQKGKKIAI